MIPDPRRAALAAALCLAAAPAAALDFRDSHFGEGACYVRAERPEAGQVTAPNNQWATFSIEEDTTRRRLGGGEMAVVIAASGGSGSHGRRIEAVCQEAAGGFACEVGQDRGRFTLAARGENIALTVEELNLPGHDEARGGLARFLSERGEERSFVLVPANARACL